MSFKSLMLEKAGFTFHTSIPLELLTGTGEDPRPRVRVDTGQTSFYENREFRYYHEFSLAAGASVWLKLVAPEIIIHRRDIILITGQIRYALVHAGTGAGTWTPIALHRVNHLNSAPAYTPTSAVSYGGSVTDVEEEDVMIANAGTGGNSSTASIGLLETALSAGTHYIELRNNGSQVCKGIYRVAFEEWKPSSSTITTT